MVNGHVQYAFGQQTLDFQCAVKCATVLIHTWHPQLLAQGAMAMVGKVIIDPHHLVTRYHQALTLSRGERMIVVTMKMMMNVVVVEDAPLMDGVILNEEIAQTHQEEEIDQWVGREEIQVVILPVSLIRLLVVVVVEDHLKGACLIRIEFLVPVVRAIGPLMDLVQDATPSTIVIEHPVEVVH